MTKRSRVRFPKHRDVALTKNADDDLVRIASLAGVKILEVIRRIIDERRAFYLSYASTHGKLPPIEAANERREDHENDRDEPAG